MAPAQEEEMEEDEEAILQRALEFSMKDAQQAQPTLASAQEAPA